MSRLIGPSPSRCSESVSALLFATARQVAADQHLLEPGPGLDERRRAFLGELRGILASAGDKLARYSRGHVPVHAAEQEADLLL